MEKNNSMSYRFIISGGGTGGHIFPAIAIADQITKLIPDAQILFIGAKGKMEMEKVPNAGYRIEAIPITGINRSSIIANLKFPFKLIYSLFRCYKIIKKFKPNAAIGTGGFASGPALWIADFLRIPTFIQEQNSFPGITNKYLSKQSMGIFVAYEGMQTYFNKVNIFEKGNPIRKSILENIDRIEAKKQLNLNPDALTILSVGGSLGARTMNNFWSAFGKDLVDNSIQLLWQTGSSEYNKITSNNELKNDNIIITEFIKDINIAYAAADIIISRAGAIAISELCLVGKAVVLIPFPFAAEDHQTKNADYLVSRDAAIMVKDADVKNNLLPVIKDLIKNTRKRNSLGKKIKEFARPDATSDIVSTILKILKIEKNA